ncbi:hypothetical protein H4219_000497 [Mycoemilia scoparia]|uniref:AAA+ ATPase domain-containing protein n=1 Tax=Mycoemilia scoparia TaxID=417184 RepID=A0A9W8DWN4_9FUNG|nr:hypothetical protein H4219_000497 [Mycoemilia scoparia]
MISQDVLENIAHPKLEIDLEKVLINSISGGDISDYFQQTLDDVLERAQLVSPSIIVADHLESLIDYDNNAYPATSSLSLFTQFINRIPAGVFVISIGSDFQKSDIRLKALSEMPLIIDISIPTLETRTLLLRSIIDDLSDVLKNTLPEKYIPDGRALENQILSQIAELTSGYTARDLKSVCRQAYLLKYNDNQNLEYAHDSMDIVPLFAKLTLSTKSLLTLKDFRTPLQIVRPSQQIMFETNIPKTFWKQICGYDSEKAVIKRFIALNSGKSTKLGINPQSGLLLYGPSGCGKTFMAQAAMTECNYNVIQLKTTELYSKYFGQTEAHIRRLFKTARSIAPVIVFMDDIDMIAAKREWDSVDSSGGLQERVLSTLLNEMDGIESRNRVMFIGCTNQPQNVDDAILRPGRFDKLVKIAYPSESDRKAIFNLASKKLPLKGHIDFEDLAKKTEGFTCSQMDQLIRETGMAALRENLSSEYAEMRHFKAALDTILSQLSVKSVERDAEMHAINAFENDIEK